jgi:hypothetical protein
MPIPCHGCADKKGEAKAARKLKRPEEKKRVKTSHPYFEDWALRSRCALLIVGNGALSFELFGPKGPASRDLRVSFSSFVILRFAKGRTAR